MKSFSVIFIIGLQNKQWRTQGLSGGRAAHPEDQKEEEMFLKMRKNRRNYRKMRKDLANVLILPTREAGYGPENKKKQLTTLFIYNVQ